MVGKAESEVIRNEGDDARPWCLPFWTEAPDYSMERDNRALALARREVRDRREARRPPPKEVPVATAVDEDDVPLILPTAEELENIRREAWNAGLEQGLVEGRQQGQKEGYDAGFKEGRDDGHKKGLNEGKGEGLKQGRDEGLAKGQKEIDTQVKQLQAIASVMSRSVLERDAALPEVLARLVEQVCVQVLRYELTDGARRIGDYIRTALEQLPETERQQARVYISNVDANELVNDSAGELVEFRIDPTLKAGQCRIESPNSQAEYNVEAHLQELLAHLLPMLASHQPDSAGQQQDLELAVEMEVQRRQQIEDEAAVAAEHWAADNRAAEPVAPSFSPDAMASVNPEEDSGITMASAVDDEVLTVASLAPDEAGLARAETAQLALAEAVEHSDVTPASGSDPVADLVDHNTGGDNETV